MRDRRKPRCLLIDWCSRSNLPINPMRSASPCALSALFYVNKAMRSGFIQMLRSRSFAVCVHVGLWLLLYLAVRSFGGGSPIFRDSVPLAAPAQSPAPVAKLEKLFSPGIWPRTIIDTNLASPFFTKYFIPAPTPPVPPPTTRKIEITYLGFYETAGSPKHVIVKLADKFVSQPIGG